MASRKDYWRQVKQLQKELGFTQEEARSYIKHEREKMRQGATASKLLSVGRNPYKQEGPQVLDQPEVMVGPVTPTRVFEIADQKIDQLDSEIRELQQQLETLAAERAEWLMLLEVQHKLNVQAEEKVAERRATQAG